jgi:hypothetical protein
MTTEDYRTVEPGGDFETPSTGPTTGRSMPLATPRRHSGIRAAFIWHLRTMGLTTLCFVGVVALITLVLNVAAEVYGWLSLTEPMTYPLMLAGSTGIFLLVMGIIMPTYLEAMLSFGITRRQNTVALLLAAATVTGGLLLTYVVGTLIGCQLDPAQNLTLLSFFVYSWLFFLIGWFVVIGYQYHSGIAILTTLLGLILFLYGTSWPMFLHDAYSEANSTNLVDLGFLALISENTATLSFISALVLIAILMPTIIALTCRIPLKG